MYSFCILEQSHESNLGQAESIHRIRVCDFDLQGLDVGEWRYITEDEKQRLIKRNIVEKQREEKTGATRRRNKLKELNRFSSEAQSNQYFMSEDEYMGDPNA